MNQAITQMNYVYLVKELPHIDEITPNDVGVILDANEIAKTYRVKFLRSNLVIDIDTSYVEQFNIQETGDRYDFKVCDRCFKRLQTSVWFEDNRHKKDNIITKRPSCRDCRKIKNGVSISSKDKLIWKSNRVADFSDFTCPICLKTTIAGITKIVLDHNHSTGKVRGWLCESCNTGIGRFDDDPEVVKRAVEWLENN